MKERRTDMERNGAEFVFTVDCDENKDNIYFSLALIGYKYS